MISSQIDAARWLILCEDRRESSVPTPVLTTLAMQQIVILVTMEEGTGSKLGLEGSEQILL